MDSKAKIFCPDPVVTYNRYGEKVVAPCGECLVCREAAQSKHLAMINEFFNKYDYAHFVTLTYSDLHVPRLHFTRYSTVSNLNDPDNHLNVSPLSRSFVKFDRARFDFQFENGASDSAVRERFNHHAEIPAYLLPPVFERLDSSFVNDLPVLNIRDVQLFLKRLRKLLNTEYHEKEWLHPSENSIKAPSLAYVLIGEYGPVHFRPHYHLIFFTSSEFVSREIPRRISEVWKAGYTHCQPAGRGSASYIAGYFNSFSTLPAFYTKSLRLWRPFFRSSRLGDISFDQGTLFENDSDQQLDPHVTSSGTEFIQSERTRQTFSRLLSRLSPIFRLDGLRASNLFATISAIWKYYGINRYFRFEEKGSLAPALNNYLSNLQFSHEFFGIRNGKRDILVRTTIADRLDPEHAFFTTFIDLWNVPVSSYVRKETLFRQMYMFCLDLKKLFKYFGLSLYNFSRQTFSVFWLKLCSLNRRFGKSMSSYFQRVSAICDVCEAEGYSDYDHLMASLSSLHILWKPGSDEPLPRRRRILHNDRLTGIVEKRRYLSVFEKKYLDTLKEKFVKNIKHKELNDRLIFTSKYLNSYDYVTV